MLPTSLIHPITRASLAKSSPACQALKLQITGKIYTKIDPLPAFLLAGQNGTVTNIYALKAMDQAWTGASSDDSHSVATSGFDSLGAI